MSPFLSSGGFYVWNAGSWAIRSPAADLQFHIVPSMANDTQLSLIDRGRRAVPHRHPHRLPHRHLHQPHPRRAAYLPRPKFQNLLQAGSTSGQLIAEVTAERLLVVSLKPSGAAPGWNLSRDGILRDRAGAKAPPGPGLAGEWAALDALWSNPATGSNLVPGSVFLDEVQYVDGACHPLR